MNTFKQAEERIWGTLLSASGNQTATYHRGTEHRTISIIPEHPNPNTFPFEGHTLTTTNRIFRISTHDLAGWLPQHGDTLEYNTKTYTVQQTGTPNTFYLEVGNYGISLRIITMEYR